MKIPLKHRTFYTGILLSILTLCSSASFIQKYTDLTGEWIYNKQKSIDIQSTEANFSPLKMEIYAAPNGIYITRIIADADNDPVKMTSTDYLTFDGKEMEGIHFGGYKKKSAASWSEDGKLLRVNSSVSIERRDTIYEYDAIEIFSTSKNGKELNVNYGSISAHGASITAVFVYDKVK
jgi:hypothetical protein